MKKLKKYWGLIVIGIAGIMVLAGFIDLFAGTTRVQFGGSGTVRSQFGGSGTVRNQFASAGGGGCSSTGISYYFNADSTTSPQTPTIGTDQLTIDATYSTASGLGSGTGNSLDNDGAGTFDVISVSTSPNNIDPTGGVVAFYFVSDASEADVNIFSGKAADASPRWAVKGNGGGNYNWNYMQSGCAQSFGLTDGTTYFLQFAWDSDGGSGWNKRYKIDNGAWQEIGSCTEDVPAIDNNVFFMANGSAGATQDGRIDQIFLSLDPTKDFYDLRDCTSFE